MSLLQESSVKLSELTQCYYFGNVTLINSKNKSGNVSCCCFKSKPRNEYKWKIPEVDKLFLELTGNNDKILMPELCGFHKEDYSCLTCKNKKTDLTFITRDGSLIKFTLIICNHGEDYFENINVDKMNIFTKNCKKRNQLNYFKFKNLQINYTCPECLELLNSFFVSPDKEIPELILCNDHRCITNSIIRRFIKKYQNYVLFNKDFVDYFYRKRQLVDCYENTYNKDDIYNIADTITLNNNGLVMANIKMIDLIE